MVFIVRKILIEPYDCKFFLNGQSSAWCEMYNENVSRKHNTSEIPEDSGQKGEKYGKVYASKKRKKMRVVSALERRNG